MAGQYSIHIGTVGQGLWVCHDGGETWYRGRTDDIGEGTVRSLAVYPDAAERLLAGTDSGLHRSDDNGYHWEKLDSPIEPRQIWSVAIDPNDTETIFAGTRPGAFRSRDGGGSWDELPIDVADPCPIGIARTTVMVIDPNDSQRVFAGIEVDGVFKSLDGGDSWVHMPDLGEDTFQGDVHCMARVSGRATYATSPYGIASSTDEGESWDYHFFPTHHEGDRFSYCRGVLVKADDPDTMFVGNGDGIPGSAGAIQRTTDGGHNWAAVTLPEPPNSVVYWLATHRAAPDVIVGVSLFGYVYLSEDGGQNWRKLDREFGEVRSVAVTAN
jgi:photosystem II stability/assembly factor-like uncharacterized protein